MSQRITSTLQDLFPTASYSANGPQTMSVRIQLDRPEAFYTNLDFITGKVLLHLTNEESISAIVVKLEGESRSQLPRPQGPAYNMPGGYPPRRDRRDGMAAYQGENHKILYRVNQVWPHNYAGGAQREYTLKPGTHPYPFQFKIPFNNSCADPDAQSLQRGPNGFGLGGLQQMQYRHVRRTLPPSMTGFPGLMEIRYYVKVTVQRPSIFKENRRAEVGFKFMPIEPPRPPDPPIRNEVFAKRPYIFQAGLAGYNKGSGMFRKKSLPMSDVAPTGEVDARLPSPPILTCNQAVPLRILLRKTNESPEYVFLRSLQVQLIGLTSVRAQGGVKVQKSTWVLFTLNALSMPIITPETSVGSETFLDDTLWNQICLPNTIAPSFHTCNVTRSYKLEVDIGLGYGMPGDIQPQTILLPLEFSPEIYSGIQPPPALLDAMAANPASHQTTGLNHPPAGNATGSHPPATTTPHHQQAVTAPAVAPYDPAFPPQLDTPGAPPIDDAPPSYEDAIADGINPMGGPRPAYSGVTDVEAPTTLNEKGGGSGR